MAISVVNADRHRGRWSPWSKFQHQRQADTTAADCAQVLERNMTRSTEKAVSAPERAARRRLWVQMEKWQGDLVTARMEV